MKYIYIAIFVIVPFMVPAQNDSFPPMEMPIYSGIPKDTVPGKLRMVVYDARTGEESYLEPQGDIDASPTGSFNPHTDRLISFNDTGFTRKYFYWLKPADSLSFFPDYPISTTVLLNMQQVHKVKKDTLYASCSGIIVDKRYILTAGHCVARDYNYRAVMIGIHPAYNKGTLHYGFTKMVRWFTTEPWLSETVSQYDIALIEADRDIGLETGWMGMGVQNDSFFVNKKNQFTSMGYPKVDFDGNRLEGDRIYYYNGHFDFRVGNAVCVNQTVYFGQSGSGFYYYNNDLKNLHTAYGVLSYMGSYSLFPIRPDYSCFTKITPEILASFKSSLLGKSELHDIELSISPNPSRDKILINSAKLTDGCEYWLYDITGKAVVQGINQPGNTDFEINIAALPAGLYWLKILAPKGVAQVKLMKQ